MGTMLKGSFSMMKQLNLSIVLQIIRKNKSISRADIASISGLTPASVTNITRDLMKINFIKEAGFGESKGGRPPVMLELNPDAGYIIGINLGPGVIEGIITNLNAKILNEKSLIIKDIKKGNVIEKLYKVIEDMIESSEIKKNKIIGIGMAVHGVVNSKTGISEFAPYYHWKKVPIKKLVEDKFGYPVAIDNDVRAMALGESWFGISKNISNFVTINISNGIGSGIMIGNKLYNGVDFSAGEIGHLVVDADGPKCSCGNYGCLESVASNISIVKKAKKLLKQGAKTSLIDFSNGDLEAINIKVICEAANKGDKISISILDEVGRYIGIAISNIVNILNPKQVVIVGDLMEAQDIVIRSIKSTVKNLALELPARNIKILPSRLGKDAATIGGITLILSELFRGEGF